MCVYVYFLGKLFYYYSFIRRFLLFNPMLKGLFLCDDVTCVGGGSSYAPPPLDCSNPPLQNTWRTTVERKLSASAVCFSFIVLLAWRRFSCNRNVAFVIIFIKQRTFRGIFSRIKRNFFREPRVPPSFLFLAIALAYSPEKRGKLWRTIIPQDGPSGALGLDGAEWPIGVRRLVPTTSPHRHLAPDQGGSAGRLGWGAHTHLHTYLTLTARWGTPWTTIPITR